MHTALLAEPVDPPDALLEPVGPPWPVERHHQTRPVLQVEALAGHVGGQQHPRRAPQESVEHVCPHLGRQASVQDGRPDIGRQGTCRRQHRGAKLREDDDRLAGAPEQALQQPQLGTTAQPRGGRTQVRKLLPLVGQTVQAQPSRPRVVALAVILLVLGTALEQRWLPLVAFSRRVVER